MKAKVIVVGSSEEIFESAWNDGVSLKITDFNTDDPYFDIYIFQSGTDIDGSFHIYKCDGHELYVYQGFLIQGTQITYDTNGTIYFKSFERGLLDHNEDPKLLTYSYDYTNNVFEIYNP